MSGDARIFLNLTLDASPEYPPATLSQEQKMLRDMARKFAEQEMLPSLREDDYPIAHHYRDAVLTTILGGTTEMHKLTIGRELFGINALV